MYIYIYISQQVEYIYTNVKLIYPSPAFPLLVTISLFMCLCFVYKFICIIFFSIPHIMENIWYLSFLVWLTTLSRIISRSIHVACCCSVDQSCLSVWDPMDCRTPGFPILYCLQELAQTQVHWVGDAIQPSCHLPSPSPTFYLSHHQGLFHWVSSSHQMAKVWELQL